MFGTVGNAVVVNHGPSSVSMADARDPGGSIGYQSLVYQSPVLFPASDPVNSGLHGQSGATGHDWLQTGIGGSTRPTGRVDSVWILDALSAYRLERKGAAMPVWNAVMETD